MLACTLRCVSEYVCVSMCTCLTQNVSLSETLLCEGRVGFVPAVRGDYYMPVAVWAHLPADKQHD